MEKLRKYGLDCVAEDGQSQIYNLPNHTITVSNIDPQGLWLRDTRVGM